jgi:anti-sigma factor RsiW
MTQHDHPSSISPLAEDDLLLLSALIDDELDEAGAARLRQRMQAQPELSKAYATMQRHSALLSSLPETAADNSAGLVDLAETFLTPTSGEAAPASSFPPAIGRRGLSFPHSGLTGAHYSRIAAGFVLGLASGALLTGYLESDLSPFAGPPDFVDEAAEAHVAASLNTSFIPAPTPAMLSRLGALIGTPVRVPDLQAQGLRMVGALLAASDSGPTILISYRDSLDRPISLIVSGADLALDETADATERTVAYHIDGLTVSVGQDEGLAFALVGRTEAKMLARLTPYVTAAFGS